jgi:hypothetical protein
MRAVGASISVSRPFVTLFFALVRERYMQSLFVFRRRFDKSNWLVFQNKGVHREIYLNNSAG